MDVDQRFRLHLELLLGLRRDWEGTADVILRALWRAFQHPGAKVPA